MTAQPPRRAELSKLSVQDLVERLAIKQLVDQYAYCADLRDADGQMALFAEDADFLVYMDSRNPDPTQHIHGRNGLAPVFDQLNVYHATMHFNGQSTAVLDDERASGLAYCLAHHLMVDGSARTLMIAAIRYHDDYVKDDGVWYFSRRKLMVDWTETRRLSAD